MKLKLFILAAIAFLVIEVQAHAGVILISHVSAAASAGDHTTVTTGPIDTTGADFIAVCVGFAFNDTISSVTDSEVNSVSARTAYLSTNDAAAQLFFIASPSTSATHTFTVNCTASCFPSADVAVFRGSKLSSPYESENGAHNDSSATLQPGSISPAENNELLISCLGFAGATATASIDSGFSISDQQDWANAVNIGSALAYLNETTAASKNPQWSLTASQSTAASIATFKSASQQAAPRVF